tara:strand:+ start:7949 stop:8089 length:141 start_codon:yes stop_codon:yes gene_type:complete
MAYLMKAKKGLIKTGYQFSIQLNNIETSRFESVITSEFKIMKNSNK